MIEPPTLKETIILGIIDLIDSVFRAIYYSAIYMYLIVCSISIVVVVRDKAFPPFFPSWFFEAYTITVSIITILLLYKSQSKWRYINLGIIGLINLILIISFSPVKE